MARDTYADTLDAVLGALPEPDLVCPGCGFECEQDDHRLEEYREGGKTYCPRCGCSLPMEREL